MTTAALNVDMTLARVGDWLKEHEREIRRVQWFVVVIYALMLVVPSVLPLPAKAAHIWNNLTLFAQFVFWGLWWPFVLLSMILVGRAWCGLLCPEGSLSEAAARHGLGRAIPKWIQWRGWPFVAFALTTIYGQMTSVYQYPRPALLVLGGSTLAAIAVGLIWGRNKRVWCRYLCPVTGVFSVLSKLAPVHFRVNQDEWKHQTRALGATFTAINCAPLVPIARMKGASSCHMCGRCSGFRNAVTLARRSPNDEIVHVAGLRPNPWETALILVGLIGLAGGAFHWTSSSLYVAVRQVLADKLVDADIFWPIEAHLPWFILTDYPSLNDTMTPLDGLVLIGYIIAFGLAVGASLALLLALSTRIIGKWSWTVFHHLVQALIPVAGCGVFLGLSALTVTMLKAEGIELWGVNELRLLLLAGASCWSFWLGWRITGVYAKALSNRVISMGPLLGSIAIGALIWADLFWRLF